MTKQRAQEILDKAFKELVPDEEREKSLLSQIGGFMTDKEKAEKVEVSQLIKELNKFAKFVSVAKERLRVG